MAMKFRQLGSSGLMVSELALGAMIFGEKSERRTEPEEAQRMIAHYLEAGGNHIDTADVYAGGRSEEIVGKAIQEKRDRVILATKVRFPTGPGPNDVGLSRYHIVRSVEHSLRQLRTETVELLYMHSWDALTPLEESLRAFDDLVRAGKVQYIGVSNFKAWQVMKSLGLSDQHGWARFVAAQYQYSLVQRDIEQEYLELFQAEGVGLVPWGPLGGGFLTGKYRRDKPPETLAEGRLAVTPDEYEEAWSKRATEKNWNILAVMDEMLAGHPGATHAQLALAWLLTRPTVAAVVLGARTLEQLDDNLKAVDIELTAEELGRLDAASEKPKDYPYRLLREAGR